MNRAVAASLLILSGCGIDFDVNERAWNQDFGVDGLIDIYQPRSKAPKRPAVVLMHFGGWTGGDKSGLDAQAARLARAGFVVGNTNYRLAPKARFPAPAQDGLCAIAFLRANATALNIDPTRIGLLGYSAGANLSEMVGLPGAIPQGTCAHGFTGGPQAVIAGAGPVDLLDLSPIGDPALIDLIGATKAEAPEKYRAASPLRNVVAGAPPYLLVHGTGDLYVPSGQAVAFRDAMVAAGNDAQLVLLEGSGHQFNPGAEPGAGNYGDLAIDSPEAWPVIIDFLHRTLGVPPP